ncbi:MAG: outer membrane protein assembly factor BamB [Rhodocyclaceae bacterium]
MSRIEGLRCAFGALLCLSLAGCFSSSKAPEPMALTSFQPAATLVEDWSLRTGDLAHTVLRPVTGGASVFAASARGELARYEGGRELWSIRAAKSLSSGVAVDGRVAIVSTSDGKLLAFDSTQGKPLWNVQLSGEVSGQPLIADELVIVRVGDNQVLAFDVADGKRRWVYERAQSSLNLRTYSGVTRLGDAVLAGFSGGKLVLLSLAGGFPRWEATVATPRGANELERMTDIVGEPLVRGDQVCVAAYQARVACVEATRGTVRWTRDIPSGVGADADDTFFYVTDSSGAVHALDLKTGATAWKQDKLLWRGLGRPLVFGDYVVVADTLGWVHLLNRKDGLFAARLRADSTGFSAPLAKLGAGFAAQARDGTVVALSIKPAVK